MKGYYIVSHAYHTPTLFWKIVSHWNLTKYYTAHFVLWCQQREWWKYDRQYLSLSTGTAFLKDHFTDWDKPNMNSSVTSYVAGEVVSKSVDDFSSAVGKLDLGTETRCSDEEYKRLLKHREKLREKHIKMEADRQTMRQKIRMKYGIKENDRHKSMFSSEFHSDEKESLVCENESSQKESESCLSCISCCFKTKWITTTL